LHPPLIRNGTIWVAECAPQDRLNPVDPVVTIEGWNCWTNHGPFRAVFRLPSGLPGYGLPDSNTTGAAPGI